jgi:putative ABC transporter-associated repeat protein
VRTEQTARSERRTTGARAAASADVASDKKVLDEGHVDFAARVLDGELSLHVKDGTVPGRVTWREPSSVVLHIGPAARNTLPDNEEFGFLGKGGDPVWLLDQVQQEGLLWPGWSTDSIASGTIDGGLTFSLTGAEGPGTVALYTYDAMSGADVLFNSADGVPDAIDVAQNTHAHGGWAFTEEGTYRLTFTMSGTLANGAKVSDTETVAFVVGDTDPGDVTPGDGSGGVAPQSPRTPGSSPSEPTGTVAGSGSAATKGAAADDAGGSTASGTWSATLLGSAAVVLAASGFAAFLIVRRRRSARD